MLITNRPKQGAGLSRREIVKLAGLASFFPGFASAQAQPQADLPPGAWTSKTADLGRIQLHYVEQGQGPLVLLCHGFPESWYSWRHQIPAIAAAGYRVVAPDLRGYGRTGGPQQVDAYAIRELTSDLTGLLDVLQEKQCVLVGHDFGAVLTWNAALLAPQRFHALATLSVPYNQRGSTPPVAGLRRAVGGRFNYIVYFQQAGVAEAELNPNISAFLRAFYYSASAEGVAELTRRVAHTNPAGLMDTLIDPKRPPTWMSPREFDFYVAEFTRNGLTGPLNWYRNLDVNWSQMEKFAGATIVQPTLFIAGAEDPVLRSTRANFDRLASTVPKLAKTVLIPNCGHWVQQEQPETVNRELIAFLKTVHA